MKVNVTHWQKSHLLHWKIFTWKTFTCKIFISSCSENILALSSPDNTIFLDELFFQLHNNSLTTNKSVLYFKQKLTTAIQKHPMSISAIRRSETGSIFSCSAWSYFCLFPTSSSLYWLVLGPSTFYMWKRYIMLWLTNLF